MGALGVHVELLAVAGVPRLRSLDHYAQQNQDSREHHQPLRRRPGSLPLLLHPQLDLQVEDGWVLLLDSDPEWHVADGPLR